MTIGLAHNRKGRKSRSIMIKPTPAPAPRPYTGKVTEKGSDLPGGVRKIDYT